jgi:hypothetical protein
MKLVKHSTRILITLSSLGGFLMGWVFLAHAPKPASTTSATTNQQPAAIMAPLPTLAPLPDINQSGSNANLLQFQPQPQIQIRRGLPRLRTSGS